MNETVDDVVSSSRSVRDSREVAASWANGHIKRAADGLEDVGKLAVIISRSTAVCRPDVPRVSVSSLCHDTVTLAVEVPGQAPWCIVSCSGDERPAI